MKVSPQARGPASEKLQGTKPRVVRGERRHTPRYGDLHKARGGAGGADCWGEVTVGPKIGHEVWPLRPLGYPDKGNCSDTAIDDGTNKRVAARPFKSEHKKSATRHGESRTVVMMYRS
jgi:hypothetical protein